MTAQERLNDLVRRVERLEERIDEDRQSVVEMRFEDWERRERELMLALQEARERKTSMRPSRPRISRTVLTWTLAAIGAAATAIGAGVTAWLAM